MAGRKVGRIGPAGMSSTRGRSDALHSSFQSAERISGQSDRSFRRDVGGRAMCRQHGGFLVDSLVAKLVFSRSIK
jgi:hypothetical protein